MEKLTTSEFRDQLKKAKENNTIQEIVDSINAKISKKNAKENFDNDESKPYAFKWDSLRNALKEFNYVFSKSKKEFYYDEDCNSNNTTNNVINNDTNILDFLGIQNEEAKKIMYDKGVTFYLTEDTKNRYEEYKSKSNLKPCEFQNKLILIALNLLDEQTKNNQGDK